MTMHASTFPAAQHRPYAITSLYGLIPEAQVCKPLGPVSLPKRAAGRRSRTCDLLITVTLRTTPRLTQVIESPM